LVGCLCGLTFRFGYAWFLHSLYVIVYLCLVSRPGHIKAVRFLIPILPSFFVVTAALVEVCVSRIGGRARGLIAVFAAALVLCVPAYRSCRYVARTRRPPTNDLAFEWMKTNLPSDAPVLFSPFYVDDLTRGVRRPVFLPGASVRQYRLPGNAQCNSELAPLYSPRLVDELEAAGILYFVSNSYSDDAYSDIPENQRYFPNSVAAYSAFRARLAREADLVFSVSGGATGRLGPDIKIYRLPQARD
jgi:hypothetical protein